MNPNVNCVSVDSAILTNVLLRCVMLIGGEALGSKGEQGEQYESSYFLLNLAMNLKTA